MNKRGQVGMEYLMTYGWALILIATIVGMIVFIMSPPTETVSFTSSEPTRVLVKGIGVSGNTGGLVLQNATGGKMTIKSITFTGNIGDSIAGYTLNGQTIDPYTDFPFEIGADQQIKLENLNAANEGKNSGVIIEYTDSLNLDREVSISSGNAGSARGLVASYSFEEATAGQTPDSSGNKNHGQYINGADNNAQGKWDTKAARFDGVNDQVRLVPSNSILSDSPFTISAWIKTDFQQGSYGTEGRIVNLHRVNAGTWGTGAAIYAGGYTGYTNDAICFLYCTVDVGIYSWLCSDSMSSVYHDGGWHLVTATHDGSTASLYYDGEKIASENKTYGTFGTAIAQIGTYDNAARFFQGLVEEVKIYDRVLTAAEIAAEYSRAS